MRSFSRDAASLPLPRDAEDLNHYAVRERFERLHVSAASESQSRDRGRRLAHITHACTTIHTFMHASIAKCACANVNVPAVGERELLRDRWRHQASIPFVDEAVRMIFDVLVNQRVPDDIFFSHDNHTAYAFLPHLHELAYARTRRARRARHVHSKREVSRAPPSWASRIRRSRSSAASRESTWACLNSNATMFNVFCPTNFFLTVRDFF